MKLEIDTTGHISRLSEITKLKLHNLKFNSGFMEYIVPSREKYHIIMSYVIEKEQLIGWAYVRTKVQGLAYDAGSYINPTYRQNGYARSALTSLTEYLKYVYKPIIEIKASEGTYIILNKIKGSYFKINPLGYFDLAR